LIRQNKAFKLRVDNDSEKKSNLVSEVTVGSVTIPIFYSPNRTKIPSKAPDVAAGEEPAPAEFKIYDSYVLVFYEGSLRQTPRRSTLEKAKKFAKETAGRLNRDGARAEFLSERDRRIFILAKTTANALHLDVDELCRKHVELTDRLKNGTLEQAVDFYNNHGQSLRLGFTTTEIYAEYEAHLVKRGAGEYHLRDCKRYVGKFVKAEPGPIGPITTSQIDNFLKGLGGKARSKNNCRDAIIAFFSFAQQKGFLPYSLPHAAENTTEFRDVREKIETEERAIELMEPNDIYLPHEMRKLLVTAKQYEPAVLPSMEIKAFSGVRTEEMIRLWWVMVCEKEGLIRIPDAIGKIDARRVPILQNLGLRLAVHPPELKHDRVAGDWASANSLYHVWERVCRRANIPYRRNAFRNSYFSYRMVIIGDPEIVAAEGGTSPGELDKNYLTRAPISRAMAEEWFSL